MSFGLGARWCVGGILGSGFFEVGRWGCVDRVGVVVYSCGMSYVPSKVVLERYADVLVNFALGGGKGIKKGDVVVVWAKEFAKPLYAEVCRAVWKAGGHVIGQYVPNEWERRGSSADLYRIGTPEQLDFFPKKYFRALVDEMDHMVAIVGDEDPHFLKGIDPKAILRNGKALKPFNDWRNKKEDAGKMSWTLGLYGSAKMAREAGLSEEAYWKQIIRACFLDKKDPIAEWKRVYAEMEMYRDRLNALMPKIDTLHVVGPDADVWVTPGEKRQWVTGTGRNVPTFEIFTSPDWRGTEGWMRFNQPLYRYGSLIEGIELRFEKGRVVESHARTNEKLLKEMIATDGADKVGEFSLTDKRHSRITTFMAHTLFDENMGGPQGNTHIALGQSYSVTYSEGAAKLTAKESARLGFNTSSVHTDIISTAPRTVTAHMKDGSERVIYTKGMFVV